MVQVWAFQWMPSFLAHSPCEGELPDTIRVPQSWQAAGFGDPCYTNIKYPFPVKPPHIAQTAAARYRRGFTVPPDWLAEDRDVIMLFEVASFARVGALSQQLTTKSCLTPCTRA